MLPQTVEFVSQPGRVVTTPTFDVALVLAGCGAKDGAEITEATSLLIHLAETGLRVRVFAPDRPSVHTVNHLTGEIHAQGRSILVEAARIARGKVEPLDLLKAQEFDALVFAGGFGVAKNLCNFAFAGADASLAEDVKAVLADFQHHGRAMGALCIAPLLLALHAREQSLKGACITLGDGSAKAAVAAAEAWGVQHIACPVRQAVVDKRNKWVSAPAYMYDSATPGDVYASAGALVRGLRQLIVGN